MLWHMINMQEFVINFVKNGPVVVLSGQVIFYLYHQYITDIYWGFFFGVVVVLEKQFILDRDLQMLLFYAININIELVLCKELLPSAGS